MPFIKITATATGTVPVVSSGSPVAANVPFQWVTFQNQGSADIFVADDPNVTDGYGTKISAGGAFTFGPALYPSTDQNLVHWYIYQSNAGVTGVQYAS